MVHYGRTPDRCFLGYRMIVWGRLQLWKRGIRAIAVRAFEPLSVVNGRVDCKIRRGRKPIAEAVLVALCVTKLERERILRLSCLAETP